MRNLFLRSILPLFALALTACSSTPPVAETTETMAFITHSSSMRTISFAFYSEHRPVAWPGFDGQSWLIPPQDDGSYSVITCRTGESICYGAWYEGDWYGPYWGAGINAENSCTDCCYSCQTGEAHLYFSD